MKSKLGKIFKGILFLNVSVFVVLTLFIIYECLVNGLALNELISLVTLKGNLLISSIGELLMALNIWIISIICMGVLYAKLFPNKSENIRKFMDIVNKKSVVDAKDAQHN